MNDSAPFYWSNSGSWIRGAKTRARERCRAIVARTPSGQYVAPADAVFLAELLQHHPHASQKIGAGIRCFVVETVLPYGNRGLRLYRTDGTSTDFSWPECITPTPHAAQVKSAMRLSVDPQILSFKQYMENSGQLRCVLTSEWLSFSTAEADHLPPGFIAFADTYAEFYGGYQAVVLEPSRDNLYGDHLMPPHDTAWPEYHQKYARLQILCKPCHSTVTQQRRQS